MSAEPVCSVLDSDEYKQSIAARIRHSENERIKRQQSLAAGKPQLFGDHTRYVAAWWAEDKADAIYQFAKAHGIAHPVTQLGDLLEPGVKLVAVWRTCLSEEQVYARILEIEQERLVLEEPPVSQDEVSVNKPEATTNTPEAAPAFEELPGSQQAYLMYLYDGMPVNKNAATRLALRRYGYIVNSDLWDAQMLTDKGRAVVETYLKKGQDSPLLVSAGTPAAPVAEQQTEEDQQPDRTTPTPNSPRGKYAVALLQGGYPDQYAECSTMGEVYRKLQDLGYMYIEAMGLWVGGGKAHLQVEDGSALHERLIRAQETQDDTPPDDSDDGAPEELNYIDPDAIAASLPDDESGAMDDIPLGDDPPDSDEDDPENHLFGIGTKVTYCGEPLALPDGGYIQRGHIGQVAGMIDTAGTIDGAMVAFNGRAGEVSVPLTDLRREDEGCNRYGEPAHIQRGNLVELHPGDQVSAGSQAGYVIRVLPGSQADVQYFGWTEPRRVSRAGLVVTKTALEAVQESITLEARINKAQTDIARLQQLLQQAKDEASKPAPLPNLGELDVLRAENAALRAQITDMQRVTIRPVEQPKGDLFRELEILDQLRQPAAYQVPEIKYDLLPSELERLLNQGSRPLHFQFMPDDTLNAVFVRNAPASANPTPSRESARTADDLTDLPAQVTNGAPNHVD